LGTPIHIGWTVRLLQELRRQLRHPSPPEEVVDQPVTPAA
jgi:hypothetical protein